MINNRKAYSPALLISICIAIPAAWATLLICISERVIG